MTSISPTSILPSAIRIHHPPPAVSPLDNRQYRALTLANHLSVLLVSDPLSEHAAASLDVEVGSYSDPPKIPGLAHFLEHMLFLSTVKYPDDKDYSRFLAQHGGSDNAYTAAENTNYHFEIAAERDTNPSTNNFYEALDRFAQFFIAPLFTESATERELNAVHSEFQKNLQSDSWRRSQFIKSTANPQHPFSRFNIGSRETLHDTPLANLTDVRAELIRFHQKYYSANIMKLCVVAPYELDVLQTWVIELFSPIENRDIPYPWLAYREIPPLLPEQKGRIFYVETINDIRLLELSWLTYTCLEDYRSKPSHLLCDLLGDAGEGSILSLLKKNDWGDHLSATMSSERTFGLFYITVTLTKKGVNHIDEIITIIFEYIRLLKRTGTPKWLFDEEATVMANAFRFREREGPYGLSMQLSSCMHYLPPEEYLSGLWLYKDYEPEKVMSLLESLTPEQVSVTIAGQFVKDKTDKRERWFGTPYGEEKLDSSRMQGWKNADYAKELHIPEPNPFIPTDFNIIGQQLPPGTDDKEGPRKVLDNEHMEVYHKLDRSFNRPKAVVVMKLESPLAFKSPRHLVLCSLFIDLLMDSLTEFSCVIGRAGFSFGFDTKTEGLGLWIKGYNHRIQELLIEVVKKLVTFKPDPVRFEMIRDAYERSCSNFSKGSPVSHASYRLSCMLLEPYWEVSEQLQCLRDGSASMEAVSEFSDSFLSRLFITALVSGNIDEKTVIEMMSSIQQAVGYKPLLQKDRMEQRVVQCPLGGSVFSRQKHPNPKDTNSAIDIYYQCGKLGDFKEDAIIEVLESILEKPMYHELRTVQQLGYIVYAGLRYLDEIAGFHFVIQSTVASPDELLRRIDKFLLDIRTQVLEGMSEEEFQGHINALVASKSQPEKRHSSRAFRFWGEISGRYFEFNRMEREVEALRVLHRSDVIKFFDDYIASGGSKRRRIVSQVHGSMHSFDKREDLEYGAVDVQDWKAFRKQSTLHPHRTIITPSTNCSKVQTKD